MPFKQDGHIYALPCAAILNHRSVLPLPLLPCLLHSGHFYRDGSQNADSCNALSYDLDYLDLMTLEETTLDLQFELLKVAALKMKKAKRALFVLDHHFFFFCRYWKLSIVKQSSATDKSNIVTEKTLAGGTIGR